MHLGIIAVLIVLAGMSLPARSQPFQTQRAILGCVPPDKLNCGCYVRVAVQSCSAQNTSSRTQLFSGLAATAPLLMKLDGSDIEVPHVRHRGAPVKGDVSGQWEDEYASEHVNVNLTFTPSSSTGPKSKPDGCEYSDYKVKVVLRVTGQATRRLQGKAVCGC